MPTYDWEIKASNLEVIGTRYARAPKTVADVIEKNLRSVAFKIMAVERRVMEVVKYKGTLIRSVSSEYTATPPTYKMAIGPTAKHALIVRTGTRPHWAPIGPLKEWAKWKLGDENAAYAVQKNIAKFGTSQWLARKGIPGAEQTEYGIGFNYVRVTLRSGGIPGQLARTAQRIPLDVTQFLNTGEQVSPGGATV